MRELSRQTFACVPDAMKAVKKLEKKFKYHHLNQVETSEEKENDPDRVRVKIRADLEEDCAKIQEKKQIDD